MTDYKQDNEILLEENQNLRLELEQLRLRLVDSDGDVMTDFDVINDHVDPEEGNGMFIVEIEINEIKNYFAYFSKVIISLLLFLKYFYLLHCVLLAMFKNKIKKR